MDRIIVAALIGNFGNIQKSGLFCAATAATLACGSVQTVLLISLPKEEVRIGSREWKLRQMLFSKREDAVILLSWFAY